MKSTHTDRITFSPCVSEQPDWSLVSVSLPPALFCNCFYITHETATVPFHLKFTAAVFRAGQLTTTSTANSTLSIFSHRNKTNMQCIYKNRLYWNGGKSTTENNSLVSQSATYSEKTKQHETVTEGA